MVLIKDNMLTSLTFQLYRGSPYVIEFAISSSFTFSKSNTVSDRVTSVQTLDLSLTHTLIVPAVVYQISTCQNCYLIVPRRLHFHVSTIGIVSPVESKLLVPFPFSSVNYVSFSCPLTTDSVLSRSGLISWLPILSTANVTYLLFVSFLFYLFFFSYKDPVGNKSYDFNRLSLIRHFTIYNL